MTEQQQLPLAPEALPATRPRYVAYQTLHMREIIVIEQEAATREVRGVAHHVPITIRKADMPRLAYDRSHTAIRAFTTQLAGPDVSLYILDEDLDP